MPTMSYDGKFRLVKCTEPDDRKFVGKRLNQKQVELFLRGDYERKGTMWVPKNDYRVEKKTNYPTLSSFKDSIDKHISDDNGLRSAVTSADYLEKIAKEAYSCFEKSLEKCSSPSSELTKKLLGVEEGRTYKDNKENVDKAVLSYIFSMHFVNDLESETNGVLNYAAKERAVKQGIDDIILGSMIRGSESRSILNLLGPKVSSITKAKNYLPENGNPDHACIRRYQVAENWHSMMKKGEISISQGINIRSLLRTVSYSETDDAEDILEMADNYHKFMAGIMESKKSRKDTIHSFSQNVNNIRNPYFRFKELLGYNAGLNGFKERKPDPAGELFLRNYIAGNSRPFRENVRREIMMSRYSLSDFGKISVKLLESNVKKHLEQVLRFRDAVFQK